MSASRALQSGAAAAAAAAAGGGAAATSSGGAPQHKRPRRRIRSSCCRLVSHSLRDASLLTSSGLRLLKVNADGS